MKHLFRRLLKRTPWWALETEEIPDPNSRRVTRQSASPLNQVLVKPALDKAKKEPSPADRVLGNSELEVAPEEFNPYNTGAFDRASSWDKISRQKKR